MNVIFLDVDGVLNCERTRLEGHQPRLQPECVARLARLIEETGAVVVVSSVWRLSDGFAQLCGYLTTMGVSADAIIDRTPELGHISKIYDGGAVMTRTASRGEEIQAWLTEHDVHSFVILDDDTDMGTLSGHLVQTSSREGLTDAHIEQAKGMLSRTP